MAERAEPALAARTGWSVLPVLRRMASMPLKDPFAFTGVVIYILFALVALFADQLAPIDPLEILFTKAGRLAANVPPSVDFPLGTTNLGRDIYAQLVHGTRSALAVGLSAAIIVATVGTIVGTVLGVLIFNTLTNVFTLNNRNSSDQAVATGVIIVIAVLLQQRVAERSGRT